MTIHLWFNGGWGVCSNPETCRSQFHFNNLTLAEARQMPREALWTLLEIIDAPVWDRRASYSMKLWYDIEGYGHRSYDLPAEIYEDAGYFAWRQHGDFHRTGDKPARVWSDGSKQWWVNGELHRPQHLGPASIDTTEGYEEFYEHGNLLARMPL